MRPARSGVLGALSCLLLGTALHAQTPAAGAQTTRVSLKFAAPRAGLDEVTFGLTSLNRRFQSVCSFKAIAIELDPESARAALKAMKKGERLGDLRLVTDGESFPYSYALRDVVLSNILERANGSARLSLDYSACLQVRR